jgi:Fe-Mn family superoxide dismutase
LYWETLIPGGASYPVGRLGQQIIKQGGPGAKEKLLRGLFEKATTLRGSGWVLLVAHARTREISLQAIKDHDILSLQDYIPLVIVDCWEHAYYLDYAFNKRDFFESFISLINWDIAEARFASI